MSQLSAAAAEHPGLLDRLVSVPSRRPRHSVSCSSSSRGTAGCPASEQSRPSEDQRDRGCQPVRIPNRMAAIGRLCLRGGYDLRAPGEVYFFTVALL